MQPEGCTTFLAAGKARDATSNREKVALGRCCCADPDATAGGGGGEVTRQVSRGTLLHGTLPLLLLFLVVVEVEVVKCE